MAYVDGSLTKVSPRNPETACKVPTYWNPLAIIVRGSNLVSTSGRHACESRRFAGADSLTELDAWPAHFFGEVNAAVLAAHNAAAGPLAPTGGALTL